MGDGSARARASGRGAAAPMARVMLAGATIAAAGCEASGPVSGGAAGSGPGAVTAGPARAALVESAAVREQSIEVLLEAAASRDPQARANAIEGLEPVGTRAAAAVRSGLVDENVGVRSVATMVAGRANLTELAAFVRPNLSHPSPFVRASAVLAMSQFGEPVNPSGLADSLLRDPSPAVRAHCAFVLGELGDASALPLLREAASAAMPRVSGNAYRAMQLQVAEAMVKLGDETALQSVRAALFPARAEDLEMTTLAVQIIGRVQDAGSAGQLIFLSAYTENGRMMPPEVRLAAADALARMGRREGWFVADDYAVDSRPLIRAQAAHVYGQTRGGENLAKLAALLEDSDGSVRVAAASGVLAIVEGEAATARAGRGDGVGG